MSLLVRMSFFQVSYILHIKAMLSNNVKKTCLKVGRKFLVHSIYNLLRRDLNGFFFLLRVVH